ASLSRIAAIYLCEPLFERSPPAPLVVAGPGGEYGSGVPILIGGYFFRLSSRSATIFVTGATTHELVQGTPSRSSFRSVRRFMTFGSGRVNGGSYMFTCQIKCTFQFRHLTADKRSATEARKPSPFEVLRLPSTKFK